MNRSIKAVVAIALFTGGLTAQAMMIETQDGRTIEDGAANLKKRVVVLDSGEKISYASIGAIATDDFDTYESAVKRTSRPENQHVTVRYTGKGDVNILRLEKLQRKRNGAGMARGAGGLLMLLGALSGDREVYSAGLVTYGVGTIVKDINTDKTLAAQTEAIRDLQEKQQKLEGADSFEEQFRIEYGDDNVDGLVTLANGNHEQALALADAGEASDDANYRMWAVWLKAIIYADQGDRAAVEKEYARLIVLDPEVSSVEEADEWMELLLGDLAEIRSG